MAGVALTALFWGALCYSLRSVWDPCESSGAELDLFGLCGCAGCYGSRRTPAERAKHREAVRQLREVEREARARQQAYKAGKLADDDAVTATSKKAACTVPVPTVGLDEEARSSTSAAQNI